MPNLDNVAPFKPRPALAHPPPVPSTLPPGCGGPSDSGVDDGMLESHLKILLTVRRCKLDPSLKAPGFKI